MEQMTYQQQATIGATGVELVVALYDGALRSLYRAKQCVIEDDKIGRMLAVKKFVDIVMYLQARLRPVSQQSPPSIGCTWFLSTGNCATCTPRSRRRTNSSQRPRASSSRPGVNKPSMTILRRWPSNSDAGSRLCDIYAAAIPVATGPCMQTAVLLAV